MFKELFPHAQASTIAMLLSAEGEKLRVTLTQKSTKKGAPLSISVVGTPDELDDELPGAIAAAAHDDDPEAVAEQVKRQLVAGPKAATKRAATTSQSAPAPSSANDKPKSPTKAERKEKCVADYIALMTAAGDKGITRETFIEKAATGRDFERLFDNWTKFKAIAQRALEKQAAAATKAPAPEDPAAAVVDDKTMPLPLAQGEDDATRAADTPPADESAAVTTPPPAAQADPWPFSTTPKDVELGHDRSDTAHGSDVYDEEGRHLSSITTQHEVGGVIGLINAGEREVVSIDGRRIITKPAPRAWMVRLLGEGGFLFNARESRAIVAGEPLEHKGVDYIIVSIDEAHLQCWVRRKLRQIVSDGGDELGVYELDVEPGAPLVLEEVEHTVMSATAERIVVRPPAPKIVRKIVDEDAEQIGALDREPAIGEAVFLAGLGTFNVIRVTEKAVFVERASTAAEV